MWLWYLGGYLHSTNMKKFLKILLLWNCRSDFELNSQKYSLGDPFQKLLANFDLSRSMALVVGGYLLDMDIKKYLKNFAETAIKFWINSTEMFFGVTLFKTCSWNFAYDFNLVDLLKHNLNV